MKLIDKDALAAEIERQILAIDNCPKLTNTQIAVLEGDKVVLTKLLSFLDTIEVKWVQEEPVSEDLIDATNNYCVNARKGYPRVMDETDRYICNAFKAGAKWQIEHLWKPADGQDLPEYDREVIVLTQPYPLEVSEFIVTFAHRPAHEGLDGKSITTGKVEHYMPMTYGKGGWNVPDVIFWLDVALPKQED